MKDLLESARERFQAHDYAAAEPLLEQALVTARNFADIHHMLGVISHDGGKFGKAIEAFQEALKINPAYTEALLSLAVTYNDLGMYNEARAVFARAKQGLNDAGAASEPVTPGVEPIDPFVKGKLANMHNDLGDVYAALLQYEAAIAEYGRALALRADFADIRTSLGKVLREAGRKDESLRELIAARTERPRYAPAGIQLGVTYYSLGRHTEAKTVWNDVLAYDPANARAKMFLKLVSEMGKPAEGAS